MLRIDPLRFKLKFWLTAGRFSRSSGRIVFAGLFYAISSRSALAAYDQAERFVMTVCLHRLNVPLLTKVTPCSLKCSESAGFIPRQLSVIAGFGCITYSSVSPGSCRRLPFPSVKTLRTPTHAELQRPS